MHTAGQQSSFIHENGMLVYLRFNAAGDLVRQEGWVGSPESDGFARDVHVSASGKLLIAGYATDGEGEWLSLPGTSTVLPAEQEDVEVAVDRLNVVLEAVVGTEGVPEESDATGGAADAILLSRSARSPHEPHCSPIRSRVHRRD